MSLIERMLKQKAVYWALGSAESAGLDFDDQGSPIYATPVEIKCRWEERSDEFIDRNGALVSSRAVVFVDRDLKVGGVLMPGTLDTGLNWDEPKKNDGAWEIQGWEKVPDLRIKKFLRIAYL